ncbi:hypothetical protein [Planctobacterium marinum]|uniref:hypothetical protein n=1 Tax=Planctobacterium marinum TaxID=1631968 RepID=UPI0030C6F603
MFPFTEQNPLPAQHRLYLIAGQEEGEIMVAPFNKMVRSLELANHPADNLHAQVIPEGKHNEAFWAAHFQHAVQWLFKQP